MIQILRGLSSEFTDRILQDGQIGYCTDTGLVYIGDGIHGIQDLKAINDTSDLQSDIVNITQSFGQPNGIATLDGYGKLIQPLGSGEDLISRLVFAEGVTHHQWMVTRIGSICFVYFYFNIENFTPNQYQNVCTGLPRTSNGRNFYVIDERRSCQGIQIGADGTLNVYPYEAAVPNIYGMIMYPCVTDDQIQIHQNR